MIPVVATVLVICSAANLEGSCGAWPNRVLRSMPLVALGTMAYALYLWHWPLLIFWLTHSDEDRAGLTDGVVVIILAVALAYPDPAAGRAFAARGPAAGSARSRAGVGVGVDERAAGRRDRGGPRRDGVAAVHEHHPRQRGGSAEPLVGGLSGARALVDGLRAPMLPVRPTVLEASDDLPASIVDECISDFGNAALIKCTYGDPRAERTIAVAGGSHSEHWLTALNRIGQRHGFRVVTYLKMGCPLNTDEVPRVSVSNNPTRVVGSGLGRRWPPWWRTDPTSCS